MSEITIINPNDLRTIISKVVEEKLIAFSKWFEAKLIQEERPLTSKEAMEYLSMSKATFYRYIKNGKIPQHGLDQKRYFKQSELNNVIKRIN
jgi:excisionase family DNA binding protein